jgi:hypothetical protein
MAKILVLCDSILHAARKNTWPSVVVAISVELFVAGFAIGTRDLSRCQNRLHKLRDVNALIRLHEDRRIRKFRYVVQP